MGKRKASAYKISKRRNKWEHKKKQRLLKNIFETKREKTASDTNAKLVKGLDNICSQLASLDVSPALVQPSKAGVIFGHTETVLQRKRSVFKKCL